MSQTKRLLEEEEEKRDTAIQILLETGQLEKCAVCEDIVDPWVFSDLTPAYKRANQLITQDNELVEVFRSNRKELTDLIKEVDSEFGDYCLCKARMDKAD